MRNQPALAALLVGLSSVATSCGGGSSNGADHLIPIGGEVTIFDTKTGYFIYAAFSQSPSLVDDEEIGMEECRTLDHAPLEEPAFLDAGESLQVMGGPAGPFELSLLNGSYVLTSAELPWFAPNTAYSVSGTGGPDIGAFATALLSPGRVDLVSPIQETLSADEDLVVVWTSTSNSTPVFVRVDQLAFEGNDIAFDYQAFCQFEDDGSGIVPASIMRHLRNDVSPDDHISTRIRVEKHNVDLFEVSGASAAIRASSWQDDYAINYVE